MTPKQVYDSICHYVEGQNTIICNLHSACSPFQGKSYMCTGQKSQISVIDFDSVKTKADIDSGIESRKSVDAVVHSPSNTFFCFVEMKSWDLLLTHNGNEANIRKQAKKYESDLPKKLADSIEICKQITGDNSILDNCHIVYILITDIPVNSNLNSGISSINSALSALAGTSSNLNVLCNQLSRNIMNNIPKVETRYWECRSFDNELSNL